ncbi:MAG TPA: LysR substrate-binding domain-containing protein [Alphaproteobacteria bacterium]|nr:LysR substrate-binding domain-containing protein [Alphaproteobacteria bacterium]
MKPRQLEAFRAVMLMGSITAGADHLRLSQPAVSRLVRDLERSLGFDLFERDRGRIRPTPGAVALSREVDRCFVGLDRIAKAASEIRQGRAGRLRVAAIPALAVGVLPEILARFLAGRPQLGVDLIDGGSAEIAEWIADGAYDLGFTTTAASHPAVRIHLLPPVRAVAVFASTHRLSNQASVRPSDLAGEALIAPYRSTRLRASLEGSLARAGVRAEVRVETSLSAVAGAVAAAGAGVAIVEGFTGEILKGLGAAVRPFRDGVEVEYAALTSAHRRLSPAADAFLKMAMQGFARPRRQRRPGPRRRHGPEVAGSSSGT